MQRDDALRAVARSRLPAPSRAILGALISLCSPRTGRIPDEQQPSISGLAVMTGYATATVKRHLNRLEHGQWVIRDRPDQNEKVRGIRTRYTITPVIHKWAHSEPRGWAHSEPRGWAHSEPSTSSSSKDKYGARGRAREGSRDRPQMPYDIPAREAINRAMGEGDRT